ncbi:GlxA family transcriptional regulator [Marinomonas sp.]
MLGHSKNKTSVDSNFKSHLRHSNLVRSKPQTTPSKPLRKASFVLLDHFSMSSFSVALDSLVTFNLINDEQVYECDTYSVGCHNTVMSDISIELNTSGNINDIQVDKNSILIICGGFRNQLQPFPLLNKKILEADQHQATIIGLWNGSFYIADSKIKKNSPISIHQENKAIMGERFPDLNLSSSPYSEDNFVLTCSGPNSTLDMMLMFIEKEHGKESAKAIVEVIASDRSPTTDAKITNHFLLADSNIPECIKEAITLMENNIEDILTIDEITQLVGISRRQIERLFKSNIGVTPARYYMEQRLTRARQLLQQSRLSILQVAIACGFVCTAHFSRTFHRFFNQSPTEVRNSAACKDNR